MDKSEKFGGPLVERALSWVRSEEGKEPESEFYCATAALFQSRLTRVEREIAGIREMSETYSLVVAAVGEIGNNSFDHNIGNWPDIPGIFFAFDQDRRAIVLADRGQGVLKTLRQVRPMLADDREALMVAFTEILSGRSPEARGNGLKLVRKMAAISKVDVFFQTGDACLRIYAGQSDIRGEKAEKSFRGCLAILTF